MSTNGLNTTEDADMAECDGEKVVTMMDVLQEQQDFEEDANAVLGASDDKNCTYAKGYIKRQALYACMTCCSDAKTDPTKRAGVCLACSLNCHENHELIELYTKRNFRCDCGNPKFNSHPCQYNPNKNDLNEENNYNQNYSGLYCICHRPYPDPEATVEDEMIQCIICEDWLHASHLEAVVPAIDQYSEMICKGCMEKNEFLHDYSNLAITPDNVDVDVVMSNGDTEDSIEISNNIKEQNNTLEDKSEMSVLNGEMHDDMNDKTEVNNLSGKTDADTEHGAGNQGNKEQNEEESKRTDKENEPKYDNDTNVSGNKQDSKTDLNPTVLETDKESSADVDMEEKVESKNEIKEKNKEETEKSDLLSIDAVEESQPKEIINENTTPNIATQDNMSESTITEQENIDNTTENFISCTRDENKEKDEITQAPSINNTGDLLAEDHPKPTSEEEKKEVVEVKAADEGSTSTTNNDETEVNATDEQITDKMEEDLLNERTDTELVSDKQHNKECLTNDVKSEDVSENTIVEDKTDKSGNSELPMEHSNSDEKTIDSSKETNTDVSENIIETDSTKAELQDTGPENSIPISEPDKKTDSTEISRLEGTDEENKHLCIDNDNKKETGETENITLNNEIINGLEGVEKIDNDKVSKSENKTDITNNENEISNDTETESANANENKRKLPKEELKDDVAVKKAKLDEIKTCVRPKGVKKQFKGATFWPSHFRQKLCTCNECLSMYKDLSVLFLIDPEDTVTAYEMLGKEKTEGSPSSQYEKGLQALSSLDRIQQINALTEYNKMRDKLLDFLKSFKDRKEIVKEEDIKAFFAGMKPKREPDGVYFCR